MIIIYIMHLFANDYYLQRWGYYYYKVLSLGWFFVGYVGIMLVVLVLRWLRWYFVGSVGITLVVIPSLNVDGK